MTIAVTSRPVKAYLSRLRNKMTRGKDSRSLCGPADGRGAYVPESLSSIHDDGAARRLRCFRGPRTTTIRVRLETFNEEKLTLLVQEEKERRERKYCQ